MKASVITYKSDNPLLFSSHIEQRQTDRTSIKRLASTPSLFYCQRNIALPCLPHHGSHTNLFVDDSRPDGQRRPAATALKKDSSYKNYLFQKPCEDEAPDGEALPVSRKISIEHAFSHSAVPTVYNPLMRSFNIRTPSAEMKGGSSQASSLFNKVTVNTGVGTITRSALDNCDVSDRNDRINMNATEIERIRFKLQKVIPERIRAPLKIFNDDETEIPEYNIPKKKSKESIMRSFKESSVQDNVDKLRNINNQRIRNDSIRGTPTSAYKVPTPKSSSVYIKGSHSPSQYQKDDSPKQKPISVISRSPSDSEIGRDQATSDHISKLYNKRDYLKNSLDKSKDDQHIQFCQNAEILAQVSIKEARHMKLKEKRATAMDVTSKLEGLTDEIKYLKALFESRAQPPESMTMADQALGRLAISLCNDDIPDESAYARLLLARIYR